MSGQVQLTTNDGQTITGLTWRMTPTNNRPSVPASWNGGMYHIQTPNGWIEVPGNQVNDIGITMGAQT
jgi:hypothetical protein